MDNIKKALNLFSQVHYNHVNGQAYPTYENGDRIIAEAQREFDALEKSGIVVKRVETYTVQKPAARRRSAKKA